MTEFLLELFSEEIPARMQAPAAEDLLKHLLDALGDLPRGRSISFSTPRRIGCVIEDLPDRTPDRTVETRGPRVGAPEAAIAGFLRASGLTSIEQCEIRQSDKGSFYIAIRSESGRPIGEELAARVPECLDRLVWPKSMRWAGHDVRWVRPLHSILAVLRNDDGSSIVPVVWRLDRAIHGEMIEAGGVTYGHRMLAPDALETDGFADYQRKLEAAFVLLDCHGGGKTARRDRIAKGIAACAAAEGLAIREDTELLDEVTGLVEWPVIRLGRIEPRFMALPPELLTTSMRTHQKYFACEDSSGALAPFFVLVGNNQPHDGGARMVAGNERVLRARLSDAEFFWELDRSAKLESRLPKLAERVFHAKLGSVRDKVERMVKLARWLEPGGPGIDADAVERAVRLSKADLSSASVGEFPELQGVMGRYLALHEGEAPEIADAIEQHYAPTGLNSDVPTAPLSYVVALSDKIDTLVGFFAIGEIPTGSKDPFALRRAALGVIRIILANKLRLKLRDVFNTAIGFFPGDAVENRTEDLLRFIVDRLKVVLRDRGIRHDVVSALFASGADDDVGRLADGATALQAFLDGDDGRNLLIAYRRAARLVSIEEKKGGPGFDDNPAQDDFREPEEEGLYRALGTIDGSIEKYKSGGDYTGALTLLAQLRAPVDAFFDKVTVNDENPLLRVNRLRLLARIKQAMDKIADFSRIEG